MAFERGQAAIPGRCQRLEVVMAKSRVPAVAKVSEPSRLPLHPVSPATHRYLGT